MFRSLAVLLALTLPASAFADGAVMVSDPYAIVTGALAKSGAVYLRLENSGATDDRLISAQSDVADMVMLHANSQDANGVMSMTAMGEGMALPAGGSHVLERGGDHIMLMGLTKPLAEGDTFTLILTFEAAGEVVVEVPVDLKR
jgi:copper(I)-binding protein